MSGCFYIGYIDGCIGQIVAILEALKLLELSNATFAYYFKLRDVLLFPMTINENKA
jgi:hypothetical protein